jgi:hypothetical protein
MRKMQARSLAELVRMADTLDIPVCYAGRSQGPSVTFSFAAAQVSLA